MIGGDWGDENKLHAHDYGIELRISGPELNEHGYLLDIIDLAVHLDALVSRCRNQILNDLPEFEDLNPSIEHFSRIISMAIAPHLDQPNLKQLVVRISEDDIGWASYAVGL